MQNRDFLFLFDAALCNPNGDPDQENRPRMDESTRTNLVSDVRIKRYLRDYWKEQGHTIFVDMQGDAKVTMEMRMSTVLTQLLDDRDRLDALLDAYPTERTRLEKVRSELTDTTAVVSYLMQGKAAKAKSKDLPGKKEIEAINAALLTGLVAGEYIDIRAFGSALAVPGFNRAITGPIQLGWGYSLNEVYLIDSNTIVSIMNDGNSTFGRDHRLKYSLLGFIGTINARAARSTGLTDADLTAFRAGLWEGISAQPTRTKLNQYPKLYLEVTYADGVANGQLGDMRKLIGCRPTDGTTAEQVAGVSDLFLDFGPLVTALAAARADGRIQDVTLRTSFDFPESSLRELTATA